MHNLVQLPARTAGHSLLTNYTRQFWAVCYTKMILQVELTVFTFAALLTLISTDQRYSLLENPYDPDGLRWVSDDAFEISANDLKARQALSPQWEFRSSV